MLKDKCILNVFEDYSQLQEINGACLNRPHFSLRYLLLEETFTSLGS